ncbi:MAG: DNA polymerase III subunit gamma/tau [Oscillospiraceae bacterium]|jgi:DNA polymerase-3 subunit gamma/tau
MYQALYRKWRPRTFDDVVGQEHITDTLKNQVQTGRLSHAYLFIGTRGTGKTTCAKILARAVNCEHPVNGNPCNCCPACRGIESGSILDVVELDAASNNGVDNVRELRDEAIFSPAAVKKRVYIIDEVHMLSISAFNALLKILEEPPEHLMFILATTELNKVPATIVSRCQRHSFRRIDSTTAANRLYDIAQKEGLQLESDAAKLLGRLADGSMRDGLSLLDQCSGREHIDVNTVLSVMGLAGSFRIAELLTAIVDHDCATALTKFQAMWQDGKDPATLMHELSTLQRDLLMLKVAAKGGVGLLSGMYDEQLLKPLGKKLTAEELMYNLSTIQNAMRGIGDNRNVRTAAELCLIRLCEPELGESFEAFEARLARLEAQLEAGIPVHSTEPVPVRTMETEEPEADTPPFDIEGPATMEADIPPFDIEERAVVEEDVPPFDLEEPTVMKDVPPFDLEEPEEVLEIPSIPKQETGERPIIENVTKPEQHTVAKSELWEKLVDDLQGKVDIGTFIVISDDYNVCGDVVGEELVIRTKDKFCTDRVKDPEVQEQIREALVRVNGHAIPIRVVEAKTRQAVNTEKLNALERFPNVIMK